MRIITGNDHGSIDTTTSMSGSVVLHSLGYVALTQGLETEVMNTKQEGIGNAHNFAASSILWLLVYLSYCFCSCYLEFESCTSLPITILMELSYFKLNIINMLS